MTPTWCAAAECSASSSIVLTSGERIERTFRRSPPGNSTRPRRWDTLKVTRRVVHRTTRFMGLIVAWAVTGFKSFMAVAGIDIPDDPVTINPWGGGRKDGWRESVSFRAPSPPGQRRRMARSGPAVSPRAGSSPSP